MKPNEPNETPRDERLEVLSDLVRSGTPVSMYEAIEVIDYQTARINRSWFQKIKEWFK